MHAGENAVPVLTPLEREVVSLIMQGGQMLGLPKSVGAIFGLLYMSPKALSMEEIMGRLRISLGSASQGLRQLRTFKAVRAIYVPGARRDFFEAEDQFRKLIGGFLGDQVTAQLEVAGERLARLNHLVAAEPPAQQEWLKQRLAKLDNVSANARRLLTMVGRFLT
jgi:DNA-binding transcriptional regulator GbsR (MarR family)